MAIYADIGRFFHKPEGAPFHRPAEFPEYHHVIGSREKVPPALDPVIRGMERNGYAVFRDDRKNYNLNLVGIRSDNPEPNTFDDVMWVFWKWQGTWHYRKYRITTDPGLTYLLNPIHPAGTTILKPGQYRQSFRLGKHKGVYDALVQARPVTVIRDNNRDGILNVQSSREQTGFFGINIHRATLQGESRYVNNWSAGCQVFANAVEYDEFIRICKLARVEWGEGFTYTLIG